MGYRENRAERELKKVLAVREREERKEVEYGVISNEVIDSVGRTYSQKRIPAYSIEEAEIRARLNEYMAICKKAERLYQEYKSLAPDSIKVTQYDSVKIMSNKHTDLSNRIIEREELHNQVMLYGKISMDIWRTLFHLPIYIVDAIYLVRVYVELNEKPSSYKIKRIIKNMIKKGITLPKIEV